MKPHDKLDGHEIHLAAQQFPPLATRDFKQLVDDIKANGLREKIKLLDGRILDGVNRVRACMEAGVTPEYEPLLPDTDPWKYVRSVNHHRRHQSAAQRAAVMTRLLRVEEKETKALEQAARERQRSGKKKDLGSHGTKVKTKADVVAERAGVSKAAAKKAVATERANPKLTDEVADGKTAASKAYREIKKTSGHKEPKVSRPSGQDAAPKEFDPEGHEFVPSKGTPTTELWARLEISVSNARAVLQALQQRDVDVDEMLDLVLGLAEQFEKARSQAA